MRRRRGRHVGPTPSDPIVINIVRVVIVLFLLVGLWTGVGLLR